MDLLTAPLRDLAAMVGDAARERAFAQASDTELAAHLAAYLGAVAELGRLVDALLLDVVGEAGRRSENPIREERVTSRLGCHDLNELIQRTTRVSPATANRVIRAAKAVRPAVSDTTGELLPAPFPSVRDAVQDGVIGVDGVLAITDPLQQTAPRVSAKARRQAADVCVAEARGEGPDGAPPACAELLKIHAQTWALALDQDGAEPRERVAERKRSLVPPPLPRPHRLAHSHERRHPRSHGTRMVRHHPQVASRHHLTPPTSKEASPHVKNTFRLASLAQRPGRAPERRLPAAEAGVQERECGGPRRRGA